MLKSELVRALEPEMMKEQPCGVCGADFRPEAVVAQLVADPYLPPVCEPCLSHLASRAEDGENPADWNSVYADYVSAVAHCTEPVFPTVEALLEAEEQDPHWVRIRALMKV